MNALATEWAARCKAQGGTVVAPHFRDGDRVEVNGGGDRGRPRRRRGAYVARRAGGREPESYYSLAFWYGFLNCGYFVAAVGGTDKMAATTAVGTGRTYAKARR